MFEFVKDFDMEIYNEIINEVEFNIWNDRCISIIQSEIEKVIKKLFKESDIVITNKGEEGVVYREYNPTLSRLLDEEESFRDFLFKNNILKEDDIDNYWIIHKNANIKKHGARTGEKFIIDNGMKESALKFLFKLCFNVYNYKFHKTPSAFWDEKYFEKLLTKPEEKTFEIEKIIEKEIKVVDDVELNKLKKEHEELKHKFDTMQKSTIPTATNFELINKLEIANRCLRNGDFKNAKIAFNNCRTLDITCYDAYVGLIMCDYKQNNMENLADNIKNDNPLEKNENYINMNNFCDKKLVEIFNKDIEETIHYVKFEKPYQNAVIEFNNKEYEKAYRDFQVIHDYKDASDKSKELLSILEQKAKEYEKDKWYERAISEYGSLQWRTKEQKLLEYIKTRINELKEKIKIEVETLVIDKNNCSLLEKERSPLSPRQDRLSIRYIIIKDGIKYLGGRAFEPFPRLETITLPDSLEEIDIDAFYNCKNLKYNEKNGYKYLGSEKNPYMVLMDSKNFDVKLLDENTKIFFSGSVVNDYLRELIIPQSVSCACECAFVKVPNIEKVIVNHNMKVFGGFSGLYICKKLKTVELNASVNKIGEWAFNGCDLLKEFIAPKTDFMEIGSNAFCNCVNLKSVNFSQIKQLDLYDRVFCGCENLEEIVLPDNIESIGWRAFYGCKKLRSIKLPNEIYYLGDNIFEGCTSLEKIEIPQGVTRIRPDSFENCVNLSSVQLPDSITNLDSRAFRNCKNLATINLPKSLKEVASDAFEGCSEQIKEMFTLKK